MNALQWQLEDAAVDRGAVDREVLDREEVDEEPAISCRACAHRLALAADRCALPDGCMSGHFTNPAGADFELVAVHDAAGTVVVSTPTLKATWFQGCAWQAAVCGDCGVHVGWRYSGAHHFVGLITDRVVLP